MIKQFQTLTAEEKALLVKAPVLVSVLVSCSFNKVNKTQKADAIKLAHLKTFTAIPLLIPYYMQVGKDFEEQFDAALEKYFPFDENSRIEVEKELEKANKVIGKLDEEYGEALHRSLQQYASHVKRSTHTVFMDFIFPISTPWHNH